MISIERFRNNEFIKSYLFTICCKNVLNETYFSRWFFYSFIILWEKNIQLIIFKAESFVFGNVLIFVRLSR